MAYCFVCFIPEAYLLFQVFWYQQLMLCRMSLLMLLFLFLLGQCCSENP